MNKIGKEELNDILRKIEEARALNMKSLKLNYTMSLIVEIKLEGLDYTIVDGCEIYWNI
jgi:hypothetical protein